MKSNYVVQGEDLFQRAKIHGIWIVTPLKECSLVPVSLPCWAEQEEAAPVSLDMIAGTL